MNRLTIVNNALLLIGAELLNSLDDNTPNAKRASLVYDLTRHEILRSHPWSCCIKTTSLGAPLVSPPNSYYLPNDFIRLIKVNEDFRLEGRLIITSVQNPTITYVYDNKNEGQYSSGMVSALVYLLAFKLSEGIMGKENSSLYTLYNNTLQTEKSIDSQQNLTQQFFSDEAFSFKDSNYLGGF